MSENKDLEKIEDKKIERIVITISPELKRLFKIVLIFDESNFTDKVNQLIEAYTDKRIEQIKPLLDTSEPEEP
ncbi:MAG TPA: hypothetical protein ENG87_02810 [Candidatus Pacearchaeota archaeon]|nr:hypothetical protein [Candidatus Pacearchaeota archaeon]